MVVSVGRVNECSVVATDSSKNRMMSTAPRTDPAAWTCRSPSSACPSPTPPLMATSMTRAESRLTQLNAFARHLEQLKSSIAEQKAMAKLELDDSEPVIDKKRHETPSNPTGSSAVLSSPTNAASKNQTKAAAAAAVAVAAPPQKKRSSSSDGDGVDHAAAASSSRRPSSPLPPSSQV